MCIEPSNAQLRKAAAGSAAADSAADARPRIASEKLMQGARRLVIEHNGEDYVLHVTRAGRLILTK